MTPAGAWAARNGEGPGQRPQISSLSGSEHVPQALGEECARDREMRLFREDAGRQAEAWVVAACESIPQPARVPGSISTGKGRSDPVPSVGTADMLFAPAARKTDACRSECEAAYAASHPVETFRPSRARGCRSHSG